jgi:KaiC/GvpD/RAD55 family RecA-like ATPase
MNIELEIISNIVDRKDLRTAIKLGITSDFFRTSIAQEAWEWIMTNYQRPDTQGEVPDSTRLLRQFPNFQFSPTENSIKALHREAKDMYLDKDTHAIIDELSTMLEDGFDARTVVLEAIDKFRSVQSSDIMNDGSFLNESAKELKARYERRKETDGVIGIPYPWDCLNAMTGGMCPGDLIYIYGRPGMMKSWLLAVIAAETALANRRVMLYTKEIDDVTLMERVVSIILGLDYGAYRSGHLPPEQEAAFYDYMDSLGKEDSPETDGPGLFFVTDKGCKSPRTVNQLMLIAEKINPDVIFVDGFYLLNPGKLSAKKSDHEKIKDISRELKSYAQSLSVPIICTSQANRDGKKNANVGETDDAAFSDAVGQDADAMFRCFKGPNPAVHNGNSLLVVPKKVREGGAEGSPKAFIINANPSYDWSLQQYPADPRKFFQDMEAAADTIGGRAAGAQTSPFKKKKRNEGPFRI